jgi:putative flippase GtrA
MRRVTKMSSPPGLLCVEPHLARYICAGCVIFILGGVQYRAILALLPGGALQPALAWAIHFLIGSVWTHAVHRRYTFRHAARLPYAMSLARTLGVNAAMWATSTLLMGLLCDAGRVDVAVGWLITTGFTAVVNYCSMRFLTIVVP